MPKTFLQLISPVSSRANRPAHVEDDALTRRGGTNSTLALSKSIPKPCYKQHKGIFKIDTEMTCYRQYTGVLNIDTEMKCFKQYRGVLKIDTEIASVLYIRVHASRDRHCCIYRDKYISERDQVEVSKARSKSTTANNLCFRYSGGRSTFVFGTAEGDRVATLRQRNSINPGGRAESSPTSRPGGGSNNPLITIDVLQSTR
jgi:hypothetical protein